jgi:FAD/FMN-containing dehydrogenase
VVSSTGIAGLTLGGGVGWLMGKHGMVVDNLRGVELVTAEGTVLNVSAQEHPDLFWALRGGGGNFGIAASLEYQLHPVGPMIYGGPIFHTFGDAEKVLRFYREFTRDIPDELTVFGGLMHSPDGAAKLAGLIVAYCGPAEDAENVLRPVKSFGTPVMDAIGPIPYSQVNMLFDPALPRGARNYWKSSFLTDLSDDAIRSAVDAYAVVPSPMSALLFEHIHGAAVRVPPDATAFPHRINGFNMLILSQWADAAEDQRHVTWARERYAAMQPFARAARYMNYLDHDDASQAAAAYGANYARLQQVKAIYDPDNVFRQNLNIQPPEDTPAQRTAARPATQDGTAV